MKITNIKWDIDFEDKENVLDDLPTEVEVPDGMTDKEEISDWLSDKYGFCHTGFEMEDNYQITKYQLIIEECDKNKCAEIDPLGTCTVDDCIQCPNARVKIIRQDGIVMRNDFVQDVNIKHKDNLSLCKYLLQKTGVSLIEDAFGCTEIELFQKMYDAKFTKLEKWILKRALQRNKNK